MQDWNEFEVGTTVKAGTVLRGIGSDNRGLVLELSEDVEVTEDRLQTLAGTIRLLEPGEGLLSIYLEQYRGSSVTIEALLEELQGKSQIQVKGALFTLRLFRIDLEESHEWQVVSRFEQFLRRELLLLDHRVPKDEDSLLRIFAVLTLVAEVTEHELDFDFSKFGSDLAYAFEGPDDDLSFILTESGYADQFPDRAEHFKKVFQHLAQATIPRPSLNVMRRASDAEYYFQEANSQCRQKMVDILKAAMRDTSRGRPVFTDNEIVHEVIALFSPEHPSSICDPCMGLGSTLVRVKNKVAGRFHSDIYGMEIERKAFFFAGVHLILLGLPVDNLRLQNSIHTSTNYMPQEKTRYDLICGVPPFGGKEWVPDFGDTSLEEAFMVYAIHHLWESGRAVFIIPTTFLTRRSKVKKYLLEENKIDAIIELPALAKPQSSLPLSLIILKAKRDSKPFFMGNLSEFEFKTDADSLEYLKFITALVETKEVYLRRREKGAFHYQFTPPQAGSIRSNINLRPGTYVFSGKPELAQYLEDPLHIKVRELTLNYFAGGRQKIGKPGTSEQARVIRTRDLQNGDHPFYFSGPLVDNSYHPVRKDRILKDGDILIPLHDPTKAKVFQLGQNHGVFGGNPNLLVLRVDQAKIIPAYLVEQLKHPMVILQIQRAYTGSTVPRVSGRALLDIIIPLQPLAVQRAEIDRVERNYLAHYPIVRRDITLAEEPLSKYLIGGTPPVVKALKHYISNRYQGVQRYTNLLLSYLRDHEDLANHWLDETHEISLGKALNKLTHFQLDLQEITHNIEELYRLDKPPKLITGDIRKLITDLSNIYREEFEVSVVGQGAIMPYNRFAIKVIVENLLSNFSKHGELSEIDTPRVKFTVERPTEDTVEITYRNNGRPFPDALSFEEYLKADHRAGEHSGAGLGGSLIKKAIEKMDGTIQPLHIHTFHPSGWNVALLITLKRIS